MRPFYLDNSCITKVKVSVRNYTAKLVCAEKDSARHFHLRGLSATASLYSSRMIAMASLAKCRPMVFAVVIPVLGFSSSARGQKDAGSIVGTVKDRTGALVSHAKVTVTDLERGSNLSIATNDAGEYVAGPLRVARYTVTVEHSGFKNAVSEPVSLDVQQRIAGIVTLQVGQITEAIQVSGAAPLLETETSELGQVVDNKRVATLPLNGRNFAQLALLTAGTAPSLARARDDGCFAFFSHPPRTLPQNLFLPA